MDGVASSILSVGDSVTTKSSAAVGESVAVSSSGGVGESVKIKSSWTTMGEGVGDSVTTTSSTGTISSTVGEGKGVGGRVIESVGCNVLTTLPGVGVEVVCSAVIVRGAVRRRTTFIVAFVFVFLISISLQNVIVDVWDSVQERSSLLWL